METEPYADSLLPTVCHIEGPEHEQGQEYLAENYKWLHVQF